MSSLAALKDTAVDVPWRLLVAAAQPYQTLAGPALSVNFNFQPSLLPFQRLPFHHAAVPAVYFHSLLHSLAEFAVTPRPVRGSHVRLLHAPMDHFWRSVGALDGAYRTSHGRPAAAHPATGAAELSAAAHRSGADVRLSLFDAAHRPVATMIATGSGGFSPETQRETKRETQRETEGAEPHEWLCAAALTAASLSGDPRRLADGSVAQRFRWDAGGGHSAAPPWRVDATVAEFCGALAAKGHVPAPAAGQQWAIVSQQTLVYREVELNKPAEIVCAPPRVFAAYRLPPWRHRIGLPLFGAGEQPPCVALRVEVRQSGNTALAGVYCFAETSNT